MTNFNCHLPHSLIIDRSNGGLNSDYKLISFKYGDIASGGVKTNRISDGGRRRPIPLTLQAEL